MSQRITGRTERTTTAGEAVDAFVPVPLPPASPPLDLAGLAARLGAANAALAQLEFAGAVVPSVDWFLYAFVRKEAVLSAQIEGTRATLADLLRFESEEASAAGPDLEEICNVLDALRFAREQLAAPGGLPLSQRLLNETHARLMRGVRGASKQPGAVRTSQNWIGGARASEAAFVPPPPHRLGELLGALEAYLHTDDGLPPLVRAGLVHAQFETIHPYLDGNGRIGRLLITLALEHWGVLRQPLLYLSLFFKRNRNEYYERLGAVRASGDFEGWLDFFLRGVAEIAEEEVAAARELFALVNADRARVLSAGASSVAALRLFEVLPRHPILMVATAMRILNTTKPTAGRAVEVLASVGVLVETTGKRRDRWFAYQAYLDRLRVGTDLAEAP